MLDGHVINYRHVCLLSRIRQLVREEISFKVEVEQDGRKRRKVECSMSDSLSESNDADYDSDASEAISDYLR